MAKKNKKKQIIVVGGIGNTARQNRDASRVLGGGGCDLYNSSTFLNGAALHTEKVEKEVIIVGSFADHQWGRVISGKGLSQTCQARDFKYPQAIVKKCRVDNDGKRNSKSRRDG